MASPESTICVKFKQTPSWSKYWYKNIWTKKNIFPSFPAYVLKVIKLYTFLNLNDYIIS